MRDWTAVRAALAAVLVVAVGLIGSPSARAFVLSEDGCGRATGYGETNKIVTLENKTHVAWLDSTATGFQVRARTLDRATGEWSPTYTIGSAYDNHGGPALTVDSEGYLHAVYYPHQQAFRYRKSVRPNDASEWEDEVQFGSKCTYPTLVCGPDDTLYLAGRSSATSIWTVNFYAKPPDGEWSAPRQILKADALGYAHFQQAMAWSPDHQTLHLACRFYDDGTCHAIGYMRSEDFGKTWERYDGTPITLPGTAATLDILEHVDQADRSLYANGSTLRGGSIAVDPEGVPHILYNTLTDEAVPRQAWIATPDESGQWKKTLLNDKIAGLPDGWGVGMEGGLTIDERGRMFVALTAANDTAEPTMWGSPSSEIVWLESDDGGASWSSQFLSNFDPETPNWLPSLERPTGFNTFDIPGLIYTSGDPGAGLGDVLENDVVWIQVAHPPPGDANGDSRVDDLDASILAANWQRSGGATWAQADFNGDGDVDDLDASILAAHWQRGVGAAVPEPGNVVLLLSALLALRPVWRCRSAR